VPQALSDFPWSPQSCKGSEETAHQWSWVVIHAGTSARMVVGWNFVHMCPGKGSGADLKIHAFVVWSYCQVIDLEQVSDRKIQTCCIHGDWGMQ
jgi:hypothetical protein